MNAAVHTAPPFIFGVAGIVAVYMLIAAYFMNYLKRAHHDTWIELGSPSLILNNSIRNQFLTFRFLWSSRYKKLNNPKLGYLIWGMRGLWLLVSVLIIGTMLLGHGYQISD
jgi:hypothetical protein